MELGRQVQRMRNLKVKREGLVEQVQTLKRQDEEAQKTVTILQDQARKTTIRCADLDADIQKLREELVFLERQANEQGQQRTKVELEAKEKEGEHKQLESNIRDVESQILEFGQELWAVREALGID